MAMTRRRSFGQGSLSLDDQSNQVKKVSMKPKLEKELRVCLQRVTLPVHTSIPISNLKSHQQASETSTDSDILTPKLIENSIDENNNSELPEPKNDRMSFSTQHSETTHRRFRIRSARLNRKMFNKSEEYDSPESRSPSPVRPKILKFPKSTGHFALAYERDKLLKQIPITTTENKEKISKRHRYNNNCRKASSPKTPKSPFTKQSLELFYSSPSPPY